MKRILAVIVVLFISCSPTLAASLQDAEKVFKAVQHKQGKLLRYKEYHMHNADYDGSFESEYIVNRKKYTVYYSGKELHYLSFWVLPAGISSMNLLKSFTDYGLDGKVEFGIRYTPDRKLFDINNKKVGRENQKYWQKVYDEAIADAIQHFELN